MKELPPAAIVQVDTLCIRGALTARWRLHRQCGPGCRLPELNCGNWHEWKNSRGSTRSKIKPEEIAFLLIVILGIIFRIWVSLPVWMHYDENYYLNIAQSYAIRGELTPYLWRLADSNILAGGGSGYGIITLTLWLNLVQNSLFWGRMFDGDLWFAHRGGDVFCRPVVVEQ